MQREQPPGSHPVPLSFYSGLFALCWAQVHSWEVLLSPWGVGCLTRGGWKRGVSFPLPPREHSSEAHFTWFLSNLGHLEPQSPVAAVSILIFSFLPFPFLAPCPLGSLPKLDTCMEAVVSNSTFRVTPSKTDFVCIKTRQFESRI